MSDIAVNTDEMSDEQLLINSLLSQISNLMAQHASYAANKDLIIVKLEREKKNLLSMIEAFQQINKEEKSHGK